MFHDPQLDCTDLYTPNAAQLEALALLELNPHHLTRIRLSVDQWRRTLALVAVLRTARTPTVPTPRPPTGAS